MTITLSRVGRRLLHSYPQLHADCVLPPVPGWPAQHFAFHHRDESVYWATCPESDVLDCILRQPRLPWAKPSIDTLPTLSFPSLATGHGPTPNSTTLFVTALSKPSGVTNMMLLTNCPSPSLVSAPLVLFSTLCVPRARPCLFPPTPPAAPRSFYVYFAKSGCSVGQKAIALLLSLGIATGCMSDVIHACTFLLEEDAPALPPSSTPSVERLKNHSHPPKVGLRIRGPSSFPKQRTCCTVFVSESKS